MTTAQAATTAEITPRTKAAQSKVSKGAVVQKLLSRPKGATVAEVTTATGWQPHSVRAFLSGLRKKEQPLVRDQRKGGEHAYRLVSAKPVSPTANTAA